MNSRKLYFFAVVFFQWLTFPIFPSLASESLNPENTYALITGVLSWQDHSLGTFAPQNRKDQALYDILRKRGVPAKNMILLLDQEATVSSITLGLTSLVKGAPEGSSLIFYYAGHGVKTTKGEIYFANYDIDMKRIEKTGLSLTGLAAMLKINFKGKRVILMADCCYSGALQIISQQLKEVGMTSVTLTSAAMSNYSTGNWTFSQTVIDCLDGSPLCDRNADGAIALSEVAEDVSDAMKYREYQMFGYFNGGVDPEFRLAIASQSGQDKDKNGRDYAVGQYILAFHAEKWSPGRIMAIKQGIYSVQFFDYNKKGFADLPRSKLKDYQFTVYPVGKTVKVEWGGRLYQAKILKTEGYFHWITYPGWPSYWDEWVMSNRIVEEGTSSQTVMVEWNGDWYPAIILKKEGKKYRIHYIGYDASWDEWVDKKRIQFSPPD